MNKRQYFRVVNRSVNAKHIKIYDANSTAANPITFKTSGERLTLPKVDPNNANQDPLVLGIVCTYYGGSEETIQITLTGWKP